MKVSTVQRSAASFVVLIAATAVGQDATTRPAVPMNVGFLVLEGVYNSELMAPWDIFHHTVFHTTPGMRVFTVGREAGPVTSFEGLRLDVEFALEEAPRIDVLVVPSARHNMDSDLQDRRLSEWVRARGRAAKYVVSRWDGPVVAAEAGPLEGRGVRACSEDVAG